MEIFINTAKQTRQFIMLSDTLKCVVLFSILLFNACTSSEKNVLQQDRANSRDSLKSNSFGSSYTNAEYYITLQYPELWILTEESNLEISEFAVNVFRRGTGAEKQLPLGIHEQATHAYVAIWPHGLGTEFPVGKRISFKDTTLSLSLNFEVNREESKLLLLKNGDIWAYFLVPENPPENWLDYGFIYAHIRTTETSTTCYDKVTGEKLTPKECDALRGDRVVRTGNIDEKSAAAIRHILESIHLQKAEEKMWVSGLIEIEQPLSHTIITSPLTVKGRARGFWYFEGSFAVELTDADGNTLAKTAAEAQDDWMTEKFVPFETTLAFEVPAGERGKLIFHRANPSGLAENDMHYTIPVIFPPKQNRP